MHVRGKRIGGLTFCALLISALAPAPVWPVDIGDKAPDFTLPSTTGGAMSLSQFQGKKIVLLEFYVADFSPI